eukprot:SAG22_NODE_2585_length_2412_cov_2.092953_2_plen_410_part_00
MWTDQLNMVLPGRLIYSFMWHWLPGGVSSHPVLARGKGYILLLMAHIATKMAAEGYQLSVLGGIRQRYGFYGYEKCGLSTSFEVNRSNVNRHFAGDPAEPAGEVFALSGPAARPRPRRVEFEPIAVEDSKRLAHAVRLQRSQPGYYERGADFGLLAGAGRRGALQAALVVDTPAGGGDGAGGGAPQRTRMVGYMVAGESSIDEIGAESSELAVAMICSWVAGHGAPKGRIHGAESSADGNLSVTAKLAPWDAAGQLGRALGSFAESVSSTLDHNWKVLDWVATLDATLRCRAAASQRGGGGGATGASPGTVVITLLPNRPPVAPGQLGPRERLSVVLAIGTDGSASATARGAGGGSAPEEEEAPDVEADEMTMMRLLFGPGPPASVLPVAGLLQQWCPLPLYTTPPDSV